MCYLFVCAGFVVAPSAYEFDKALVLEGDAHRYGVTFNFDDASEEAEGDFVVQYVITPYNLE